MGYRVTSPLVVAKRENGTYVHIYEGGFLPDNVDPDHAAQLLEGGLVEEAEPVEEDADKPKRSRKADG